MWMTHHLRVLLHGSVWTQLFMTLYEPFVMSFVKILGYSDEP